MLDALRSRGNGEPVIHTDAAQQLMLGMRGSGGGGKRHPQRIFSNRDGSLTMVCDGEVFNGSEIVSWLAGKGLKAKTGETAELLLHLYEVEGAAGFKRADAQ